MDYPIIDCHCHIYPEKIAIKAVKGISSFYHINMGYDGRYSTLVDSGKSCGVKHFIIFSVATTPHQVHSINSFIAECIKKSNGLMTGLGTLHPDSDDIERDIAEIKSLGLKGVKLHPDFQRFKADEPKCDKIYELCQGTLPILIHTGDVRYDYSNPDRIKPVLEKYPNLTVIGAHFGGWSCWKEAAQKLCGFDNFYVDCSSTFNWLTAKECAELVKAYGSDKVLFGTDFPMWSHSDELKSFFEMNLSEEDNRKILYENAMKLFSIDKNTIGL